MVKTCEICGKKFVRNPSYSNEQWNHAKYCSHVCAFVGMQKRKTLTCPVCQKQFSVHQKSNHRFCSRNCAYLGRNPIPTHQIHTAIAIRNARIAREKYIQSHNETRTCKWCNKQFTRNKSSKNIFCSRTCKDAWWSRHRLVNVNCLQCNKTFKCTSKSTKRYRKFCSHACYLKFSVGPNNPNWHGGPMYYGPDWKKLRIKVWERDRVCQDCGKSPQENGRNLDVHHIIDRRDFGDDYKSANELSNLKALCISCHRKYQKRKY